MRFVVALLLTSLVLGSTSGCHEGPETTSVPAASPVTPREAEPREGFSRCEFGPEILALAATDGRCDATECASAGGECAWGGSSCIETCARKTADGGKSCTDDSECEAGCRAVADVPRGERAEGRCSSNRLAARRGCFDHVAHGVATGRVCAG